LVRMVDQVSLPVRVRFAELRDELGAAPAAWLIHVPRHFDRDDIVELPRLDEFVGPLIGGRAAALRSYGEDTVAVFYSVADRLRVLHGVSEWFFDVGVAAGTDGFDAVESMLEVSRADDDGLDIFVFVEFVVVTREGYLFARESGDVSGAFVAATTPDVRECDKFEIEFGCGFEEGRDEAAATAVREADNADADTVVGAENSCVARGGERCASDSGAGEFEELAARRIFCKHAASLETD